MLSSVLPDHLGAAFVDLHVHHAARVDVRSQVDLREFRLGGRKGTEEIRGEGARQSLLNSTGANTSGSI